jgi:hypothetical protein
MHASSNTKPTPDVVAAVVKRLSDAKGYAPSTQEIADELGVHQTQALRHINDAEKAGAVVRGKGLRAIAVAGSRSTVSRGSQSSSDEGKDTYEKGFCFDFGPGFAVVAEFFSRLGVEIHVEPGHALDPRQCRMLARFLMRAANSVEAANAEKDNPCGCVVYAITDGRNHKIGKAASLTKRLKQLQTGNGSKLSVVCYVPVVDEQEAYEVESSLHRTLSDSRMVGEWFSCASHTVYDAMYQAALSLSPSRSQVDVNVGHDFKDAGEEGPE